MTFNDKDYEYLKGLEMHLSTAINSNYCRIDAKAALADLSAIYERAFDRQSRMIGGCARCILNDVKRLANAYFADKKEREAEKPEEKATETPVEASQAEEIINTPPKKGNPTPKKKTAKNKKK